MHIHSYLALGDSYTIGEAVPLNRNFPYQVVQQLRKKGYNFFAPEIIAKTGWTTDDLLKAVTGTLLLSRYDFVSLLIGVNNQYQGLNEIEYKEQFEELIKKTLELTNNKKERVIAISFPDYSHTPFGRSMNAKEISKQVEVFNGINKALAIQYKIHYIDITSNAGAAENNAAFIAQDGLHPSEKEYKKWADKVVELIVSQLK